jgi:hypothetical protein
MSQRKEKKRSFMSQRKGKEEIALFKLGGCKSLSGILSLRKRLSRS